MAFRFQSNRPTMASVARMLMDTEKMYQQIAKSMESVPMRPIFGFEISAMSAMEVASYVLIRWLHELGWR